MGAAAGDQLDPRDRPQHVLEAGQFLDRDPVVSVHPAGDGLAERFGLLVDLLEHEVLVAALLGGLGRPVDGRDRSFERAAPSTSVMVTPHGRRSATSPSSRNTIWSVWARIAATSEARKLSPSARPTTSGTLWRAPTRRSPSPRCIATIAYAPSVWRRAWRSASARSPVVGLLDQVGDRFGVGLGRQRVAARLQPVAELAEVLDDPVVDDRDLAGAVLVRMGVEVVRPAVGGPAGVGEADGGVRGAIGDGGLEVRQLAGPLLDEQVARVVDQRDARRIVAAVLEAPKAFDEDRPRLTGTRIADDAAHGVMPLRSCRATLAARSW